MLLHLINAKTTGYKTFNFFCSLKYTVFLNVYYIRHNLQMLNIYGQQKCTYTWKIIFQTQLERSWYCLFISNDSSMHISLCDTLQWSSRSLQCNNVCYTRQTTVHFKLASAKSAINQQVGQSNTVKPQNKTGLKLTAKKCNFKF